MEVELTRLARDLALALLRVDQSGQSHKGFRPGIGPFGEADAVRAALGVLKADLAEQYGCSVIKRRPDLLIPGLWQIEFKVVRPFGDNGKEAENWSQNLLHPYPGNTSSLGDCLKLLSSDLPERRAIVVLGYEHDPAQIRLDPCIEGFELLAAELLGVALSPRVEERITGLTHPVHQVLRLFAWEVHGWLGCRDEKDAAGPEGCETR